VPKLFFGYATGTNLMFPFRVGATCILFEGRSTADALLDQIAKHKPTFMTGVPTLLNNMLASERIDDADLSSLRLCLSAGEALPQEVYEAWKTRTGVEVLDRDELTPAILGRILRESGIGWRRDRYAPFIQAYRQHRQDREDGVIAQMKAGVTSIPDMVKTMYVGLEERLFPAACMSLLGHMFKLIDEGRVTASDARPVVQSEFRLTKVDA